MSVDWGRTLTSKTIWLGALTIATGIIEYLASVPVGASVGTIAIGVISIVVRFLTNDSITRES